MYKLIKKHKRIFSLLLAIMVFVNMQYPYFNVRAEDTTPLNTISSTTEENLALRTPGTFRSPGMFRSPGAPPQNTNFTNFEYNLVLQKVVGNIGELNEETVDLVDKESFNKAHITLETPLNIKINTKIKSNIRKDEIIDIPLPDYPLDLSEFETNEYTDSGFTYKIENGADGKKHLILKCTEDIIKSSSEPIEYILKLPSKIKVSNISDTKIQVPFKNGEINATVNIIPKGITSSIKKEGLQEANSIRWFVKTNLFSEENPNITIKETIPNQVIFDESTNVIVKKLNIDLNGTETVAEEVVTSVDKSISGNIATITINKQIDYPIRIEFVTKVKEDIVANSTTKTKIKNTAEFNGSTSEAEVDFKPADMLEKTYKKANFNDDKISWTLKLNSAKSVIEDKKIKITELMSSNKKEDNYINSNEYTIDMPEKITIKNIDNDRIIEVIPTEVSTASGKSFEYEFERNDDEKTHTFEITYETPVKNKLTNIQTKSLIKNVATTTLSSKQHTATATAELVKSMHIKKSVNGISKTADGYRSTWKISVNFDKHDITPVVHDSINLPVTEKNKILKDTIQVYEVTPLQIGNENHPDFRYWDAPYEDKKIVSPDKYTVSEITDTTRSFDISFNEKSKKSYIITYDTMLDSPDDVVNTATLDSISASAGLTGNTHNRIYKYIRTHIENNETVYDDLDMGKKTMVFYIYVEPNRSPMENIVIDDTFIYKGLTIEKSDIKFSGETITDDDYTFEKKADATEGFILKIKKPISNKLTIETTAKFTRNDNTSPNKTHFPNEINATWKDKYKETNSKITKVEYVIPKELVDEAYKNNSNISGLLHGGTIKDRLIDWTTNINYAGEKLPANTTVKIYPIKQDASDNETQINQDYHKIINDFKIYPYTLNKYGDIQYDLKHQLTEGVDYTKTDNGDGSYTITFTNPIEKGYSIRYESSIETKYTDDEKTNTEHDIDNKTKFKMKNEIAVPSSTPVNITAIVDTKIREVFDKKGSQSPYNPYKIKYTATFNQIAEKVPQGTYIYDVLSEEQVFEPDSLKMSYSNETKLQDSDYVVEYSIDSKARHVMKIKFTKDITEPIKIEYTTHINNANATELKNAISYKEDPTDDDVKNGSKITIKRRPKATLIVPKGASVVNISYTTESCCKDGKCPVFPQELTFEVIVKDSATSPEKLYKTVKVERNTEVPINISADKFVKVKLKQDPAANPKLREFETPYETTVADKITNVKYDVSLNDYKLKIKFEGDVGTRFNELLAPNISLKYNKNNTGYTEKIDTTTLKNKIQNLVAPNEYVVDNIDTITEDMLKNSTNDKVKLEIPAGDPNLKNYKIELLSIDGKATTDKNVNNNEITLDKCAENVIVVKISRLKKHSITLKKWTALSTGVDFTDTTVANSKDISLKAKVTLTKNTGTGKSVLFEDITEDVYSITAPAIPYYITPAIGTDFISAENSADTTKVDVSKSSFMTETVATNTDALYKKAKKLKIDKYEVIRQYNGTDITNLLNKDVTFTLTDKTDSNIKAKFTVNASTQTYKVVEDNSNIIDVQGNALYVKEGQYTLTEENMNSNYYYGYIDLADTKNIPSGTADNTSVDVDLSASQPEDVSKDIYNHKDYNTLKIIKMGDGIHPVTGTKIGLFTAVNGKEGAKIDEKVVDVVDVYGYGEVTFENISDSQYGYRELEAPDGYVLDPKFYPISRPNNTSLLKPARLVMKQFANNRIKSEIVISKKDVSRDKYFSGVSFILKGIVDGSRDVSDVEIKKPTAINDGIAQASWGNLEVGTYKLYEKVPEGYTIPTSYDKDDKVDEHIFTGYKVKITDNKKIYTVDDNNKDTGKIVDNKKNATVILNTALTLNFDVKKTSVGDDRSDKNNLPLQGVQYTLTEKTNTNILGKFSKTVTTNQEGIARFENIPVGEYELRETVAIDPYKKDTAVTTVKVVNDDGTAKLIVNSQEDTDKIIEKTNSVDYGTLKIIKTAGNKKVNGVEFTIEYIADINKVPAGFTNGKNPPTITPSSNTNFLGINFTLETKKVDGEDGVIKQKLPKGIYKITEVKAPKGYKLSAPYYVKIDGNNSITPLTINNEVETVKLTIIKKDTNDSRLIKGAKFEIERKNNIDGSYEKLKNTDNTTIFTTNADGKIEVNVQKGDIRITEVTSAYHYDKNSLKLYDTTVEDSKKISGEISVTTDKTIIATNNKTKSKFVLNKKSVTRDGNSANFANVEFKLYEADENYKKLDDKEDYTFTTDENGKIEEEIDTGYYVVEETRKEGYTGNMVVKENGVAISSNGLSFNKDINADTDITVENKPIYVKLKIKKVKEGTDTAIKGATIAIFDKNDTKIAEATSGTDGFMNFDATYDTNGLKQYDGILWQKGLYYKELNRPNGYFLDDKKNNITLKDDESLNDTIIFANKQILGEIKVITYSRNKITNAEANLGNIKVQLQRFDGTNWQNLRDKVYTNDDGEFLFTMLEEGKYRVVEKYDDNKDVLKGYEQFVEKQATTEKGGVITEVEIKPVSSDGTKVKGVTNHTVYIPHEAFFGSLTINKKDTDGNNLTGVEFGLYDEQDKKIGTLITNDGIAKKENIVFGNYYIKEEKTPNNILIDESKINFSINYSNRDVVKDIENKKFIANIVVKVIDSETGEPVDNNEITITNLEKKITDTTGKVNYNNVPKGKYQINISKVNPNYIPNNEVKEIEIKDEDNNKTIERIYELTKIRTGITLTKTDEKTGEKLEGVEFELKGTKDNNTTSIVKTTDEQGRILFDNLIYDTYVIKETKTNEEYRLLEDAITVELNQENLTLDVKNTKKTGVLEFVKVDKDSKKALKNAHIEIYKEKEKIASFVTDENGRADIIDTKDKNIYIQKDQVTNKNIIIMPIGTYTIKEIQAPRGYELNKESIEFEITLDTVAPVTLENRKKPTTNTEGGGGGSDRPRRPDPTPVIPSIPPSTENPNNSTPNNPTPNNPTPNNPTPNNPTPNNPTPNNPTPNNPTPNNPTPNNPTPNNPTPNNPTPNNPTPNNPTPNNPTPNNPTPNNPTPNNPTPNNPTPVNVKIYQPRPNNPTTDNPIPDTNITNNPKDKTNIENIKKAVETRKVYTIVDKQNRPIGVARVVIKDNKLVLEYIDDPDVPRSGTIKYDGDDNSIEMIEEDTPLSNIDEDKILPKTGQSSDESRKIAVFVLMLLAIYLRRKNKNI